MELTEIAQNAENAVAQITGSEKNGVGSPRIDVRPSRTRDSKGCLELRPGQPSPGSKLDFELEKKLCDYITIGMSWTDSSTLCGISRLTVLRWKEKGLNDPESRYGEFLAKIELAEARSKAYLISKIRQADDWRGCWRLLCSQYPKEFSDHVVNELVGAGGSPLAIGGAAFAVNINMQGPDPGEFVTVDHRLDSARLPDPPERHTERRKQSSAQKPPQISKHDPLGARLDH